MKIALFLSRFFGFLVIAVLALANVSCTSPAPVSLDGALLSRAEAAATTANQIIVTAEKSGRLNSENADKLRDQISLASQALALTGKLDFTSARSLAATMAASNLLPPDYAIAIQTALLVSDLALQR
jgi:hypothetical protein